MMDGKTYALIQSRQVLKFEIENGVKMSKTPGTQRVLAALEMNGGSYEGSGDYALNTPAGRVEMYLNYNYALVQFGFKNVPLDIEKVVDRLGRGPKMDAVLKEHGF